MGGGIWGEHSEEAGLFPTALAQSEAHSIASQQATSSASKSNIRAAIDIPFLAKLSNSLTMKMQYNIETRALARTQGLEVVGIAWEDNARTKHSCWGPCITDMTIVAAGEEMPVFRYPNFEDKTWDVPIDRIKIPVGNETVPPTGPFPSLPSIGLKEFLMNTPKYTGLKRALYAPNMDSTILMSTQTAFLPLPLANDAKTEFQIGMYNYQAQLDDPAVLAVLVSAYGSSAQIVDRKFDNGTCGQKLWHNSGGKKCPLVGRRLSDDRRKRMVATEGPMVAEEKAHNAVIVIQIPLKQKIPVAAAPPFLPGLQTDSPAANSFVFGESSKSVDVEPAIIEVGPPAGDFPSLKGKDFQRDERFPVRYTVQWYKSTSNGIINAQVVKEIREQMEASRNKLGVAFSSLVVGRSTEPQLNGTSKPTAVSPPGPGLTAASNGTPQQSTAASSSSVAAVSNAAHPPLFSPSIPVSFASVNPQPPQAAAAPSNTAATAAVQTQIPKPPPPANGSGGASTGHCCDSCDCAISGTRYKCLICPDFDLCPDCEESNLAGNHPSCHPPLLLKLKLPDAAYGHFGQNRAEIEHDKNCHFCKKPIVGFRYHCLTCTVDLCERCEAFADHAKKKHPVAKVIDPSQVPQGLGLSRTELTF